ncbi:MAG: hypothetical protein HXX20_00075 [Chloroflexi bacterium]|nr:hypothetical protein [Chloroflexota bacterium]
MDFYVSWSHSDPFYQMYDGQCSMLISPTSVTSVWKLTRFSKLPYQLMLDSGSYSYISNNLPLPTPREVFKRQLHILDDCDLPTIICPVDVPMLQKTLSLTERNRAIDKTIANACELKILMKDYSQLGKNSKVRCHPIETMAIVQGYDIASIRYCARQLTEIGYSRFGIGSMAHLYDIKEIKKRVEAVQSVVGSKIHIFGISGIEVMEELRKLGITSVDSARPIKAAIYNEILYSEPYLRVGIAGSRFRADNSKFSADRMVSELSLECPCPVCKNEINNDILKLGIRKYLLLRAVHNYYHIKKMIAD